MVLDRLQHADQRRLQAGDVDAVGLLQQAVGRKPGHAGGGRYLIGATEPSSSLQVDVAVVVEAGFALDLEQRGLAHARQRSRRP